MEKADHAKALRAAMTDQGLKAQTLADLVGVSARTVGNWISRTRPTMPDNEDRATLRRVLGNYEISAGDPVEAAIRRSELVEWRQDSVLSHYKRNLHEQRAEEAG